MDAAGPGNWTLGNYRRFHMDGYGCVYQEMTRKLSLFVDLPSGAT
jgi:hypothetical protein